ncbi:hypothetical protein DFH07DRAFT_943107 [Mycena maculata]|uniref:Uncharacterized protein n=1 Tax=Mycena maculata TaxID=230809 RepID=A0AAD7IIS8_9AGAR|nr:hypothetical protein DFH07DRAFT_943107 [Mycena maculata]
MPNEGEIGCSIFSTMKVVFSAHGTLTLSRSPPRTSQHGRVPERQRIVPIKHKRVVEADLRDRRTQFPIHLEYVHRSLPCPRETLLDLQGRQHRERAEEKGNLVVSQTVEMHLAQAEAGDVQVLVLRGWEGGEEVAPGATTDVPVEDFEREEVRGLQPGEEWHAAAFAVREPGERGGSEAVKDQMCDGREYGIDGPSHQEKPPLAIRLDCPKLWANPT